MELYIHKLNISRNVKESFEKFLDPDCYPDHLQNLISCSSSHFRHFLKISSKSVRTFLSYVAKQQTNAAKNLTSLAEVINMVSTLYSVIIREL